MNAELFIETTVCRGMTILKSSYVTPPFKVQNITEDKSAHALHLMLMNASPGVLDGDVYKMQLHIGSGSWLQLHTQSYQRLFPMQNGATQTVEVRMGKGSSFTFLPHPTVPHAASNFTANNKIFIEKSCKLWWGEVVTCGRKENGEQFHFSKYHSRTDIFLSGRIVVKENLLLQPERCAPQRLGQLEGFTHQASLFYLDEATAISECCDVVHDLLSDEQGICFGVTALSVSGLAVRMLGHQAEHLHGLLKKLAAALTDRTTISKYITKPVAYAG